MSNADENEPNDDSNIDTSLDTNDNNDNNDNSYNMANDGDNNRAEQYSEQFTDNRRTKDTMWDLNFDGWTVGEDAMYMQQLARAQQTGNYKPLYPHWSRMIRHWPYALDPRNLKGYADLGAAAHQEIIDRINQGIRSPKHPDGRSGGGET